MKIEKQIKLENIGEDKNLMALLDDRGTISIIRQGWGGATQGIELSFSEWNSLAAVLATARLQKEISGLFNGKLL